MRKIYIILLLLPWALQAQFILPEKDYTSQSDVDVLRQDSGGEDLVKRLTVRHKPGRTGEILLVWELTRAEGDLAVVRSTRPITNSNSLSKTTLLAKIPFDQTSFTDRPQYTGDYYYAVVLYKELEGKTSIMKPDDNYTTRAAKFILSGKDFSKVPDEFKLLHATFVKKGAVRVEWDGNFNKDTTFVLYRYNKTIDTLGKLSNSKRLITLPTGRTYYDDKDILVDQEYYYAIASVGPNQIEVRKLIANRTYTTDAAKYEKDERRPAIVRQIQALATEKGDIIITWLEPDSNKVDKYIVYRSRSPIVTKFDLNQSSRAGSVKAGQGKFTDTSGAEGSFYYAVLSVDFKGINSIAYKLNDNVLSKPVTVQFDDNKQSNRISKSLKGRFINLQAHVKKSEVILTWNHSILKKEDFNSRLINIYRFRRKPRTLRDIMYGTLLGKIPDNKVGYVDIPESTGIYYYALFIETTKGIKPKTFQLDENLIGPIIYQSHYANSKSIRRPDDKVFLEEGETGLAYPKLDTKKHEEPELSDNTKPKHNTAPSGINQVLKQSYSTKKFKKALVQLGPFRDSSDISIKSKAYFYSALSSYYNGDYKQALKYLVHPSVQSKYGKRAKFWYNRTLEQMK